MAELTIHGTGGVAAKVVQGSQVANAGAAVSAFSHATGGHVAVVTIDTATEIKLAWGLGSAPTDPTAPTTADALGVVLTIPAGGVYVIAVPPGTQRITHVKVYCLDACKVACTFLE